MIRILKAKLEAINFSYLDNLTPIEELTHILYIVNIFIILSILCIIYILFILYLVKNHERTGEYLPNKYTSSTVKMYINKLVSLTGKNYERFAYFMLFYFTLLIILLLLVNLYISYELRHNLEDYIIVYNYLKK